MILEDFARAIGEHIHNDIDVKNISNTLIGSELTPTVTFSEEQYGGIDGAWFHVIAPSEHSDGNDRLIDVNIGVSIPRDIENDSPKVTLFDGIKTEQRFHDLANIVSTILASLRKVIPHGLSNGANIATGLSIIDSGIVVSEGENGVDIYANIPLTIKQKNCKIGG